MELDADAPFEGKSVYKDTFKNPDLLYRKVLIKISHSVSASPLTPPEIH
jgi:hypothetical protein